MVHREWRGFVPVLVLGLFLPSPARAFDQRGIYGIGTASGGWVLLDPPGYEDLKWERMAQAGCTSSRIGASWPNVQPNPGEWVWDETDAEVAYCEQYGIDAYCLIVNTPWWASPTGETEAGYPPRDDVAAEFNLFCTTLASRYAGRIKYYEFWNEENGYGWHTDGGFNRVDEYLPWLRRAYYALKAGDPDCQVGIGGLDDADGNAPIFMNLVYSYRDSWYPGEKIFDAVADHPYSKDGNVSSMRWKLRAIRNILDANGDSDVTLWLTEYGWNTNGEVTEAEQALYLTQTFDILNEPEFSYVTSAQYLAIADFETRYTGFGLSDVSLRPRPAYYAMQAYVRSSAPQISYVASGPLSLGQTRVEWDTNIPATSRVEYGTSTSYGLSTSLDPALGTAHSATLTGLDPDLEYHYRVHSTAPSVPDASSADFRFYPAGDTVLNGEFEDGFQAGYPFRWFADGTGLSFDGGIFNDPPSLVTVLSGAHSGCLVVSGGWGRPMDAALRTSVAVLPGSEYTVRAWTMVDSHRAPSSGNMHGRVGTDPAGGTDFRGPTVVWSSWNDVEEVWSQQEVSATAQNGVVTVFLQGQTVIQDNVLYFFYADDVSIEVTAPGATPTPTSTPTITPTPIGTPTPTVTPTPTETLGCPLFMIY